MPEIGEIRNERELGFKGHCKVIWLACLGCGKERWVQLAGEHPQHERCRVCSNRKTTIIRAKRQQSGTRGSNWKGGRHVGSGGYVKVWLDPKDFFYPMATKGGYVKEHRLVVAKALGRCLHRWEIVHHKHVKYPAGSIEDKQDNRYPENLQLVSDDRHKQITILENKIAQLEKRIKILEGG